MTQCKSYTTCQGKIIIIIVMIIIIMLGSVWIHWKVLSVWTDQMPWTTDALGAWFALSWCIKKNTNKNRDSREDDLLWTWCFRLNKKNNVIYIVKFDCLVSKMLFIRALKNNLNMQSDSIHVKDFFMTFIFIIFAPS